MAKRYVRLQMGTYKVIVQDYQYKGREPVSVRVTGERLGESLSPFGEPCYFYQSEHAWSIPEGIAIAKAIVAAQGHKAQGR